MPPSDVIHNEGGRVTDKSQWIVEALELHEAPLVRYATWVLRDPEIAKEVLKRGHEIGDHTWSDLNFYAYEKKHGAAAAKTKARDEMKRSKDMIQKTLGLAPAVCRMPNGYHRPWLKDVAKDFGYALVNWTFGEDWLSLSESQTRSDYLAHVKPGAILLFHDGGKNRAKTAAILPAIIESAQSKSLAFQKATEILE